MRQRERACVCVRGRETCRGAPQGDGAPREEDTDGLDLLHYGLCFRVQGSGFRVQGSGFRVQGSGFRVQGSEFSGFGFQVFGFRVSGFGLRLGFSGFGFSPFRSGFGFRVSGLAFRVLGLGFRHRDARVVEGAALRLSRYLEERFVAQDAQDWERDLRCRRYRHRNLLR